MALSHHSNAASSSFTKVEGRHFVREGKPWYVCGTNLWYAPILGMPDNSEGRARLVRELDRLQQLGVNNLRVLAAAEACDVVKTVPDAIQTAPGVCDERVLKGLDFTIQEAGKRGMTLVLFLNNYWDWSGGMAQYISWVLEKPAIGLYQTPWFDFNRSQARYYTLEKADAMYRNYVATIVNRTNTLTGLKYRDDPTIMTWQLANEPRAGFGDDMDAIMKRFCEWVDSSAAYIHSLDTNHLVSTGVEGLMGLEGREDVFLKIHQSRHVDYTVFHLWPMNWSWFKPAKAEETLSVSIEKSEAYVKQHIALADKIGKPVVMEEFGLDRDGGLTRDFTTRSRDKFYSAMYSVIEASAASGSTAAGTNFWLWGGEGKTPREGEKPADRIGAGDPFQEPSGLNTVFDSDKSTQEVIARHFAALKKLGAK